MKNHTVFNKELEVLKKANEIAFNSKFSQNELLVHYKHLIQDYTKLLNMSKKTFRISDIQGQALMQRELEIKEANKNLLLLEESRRKLISEITHEIGSPTIAIQRFINAMISKKIARDDEHLTMIYNRLAQVNQLIEDLFELSKLEETDVAFSYRSIRVQEFEHYFNKYRLDCEERQIYLDIHPLQNELIVRKARVIIDPFRIEQVIKNMINNALKYTASGGKIDIYSNLQSKENEQFFRIEIKDTGTGIDPRSLPHVFSRFYKGRAPLNTEDSSSGLGLSIAKEIIEKHKGEIGVTSELGKGSCFYFYLPVQLSKLESRKTRTLIRKKV